MEYFPYVPITLLGPRKSKNQSENNMGTIKGISLISKCSWY